MRGNCKVLAQAKLALSDNSVTIQLTVRSMDERIAELVVSTLDWIFFIKIVLGNPNQLFYTFKFVLFYISSNSNLFIFKYVLIISIKLLNIIIKLVKF